MSVLRISQCADAYNNVIVRQMIDAGKTHDEIIEALIMHQHLLEKKILQLLPLLPFKIKIGDGYYVHHCPDDLVPTTDFLTK